MDLREPQVAFEPLLEERALSFELQPALAVLRVPVAADPADHRPDEVVAQLPFLIALGQARVDRRLDLAADRLAVHPEHPRDLPQAVPAQPEPQDLACLDHRHLPEHFPHLLVDSEVRAYQNSEGRSGGP